MEPGAAVGVFGAGFMLMMMAVGFAAMVFWLIEFIDVLKSDFKGDNGKMIWVLVLLLAGPLGAIVYYCIGKKQKVALMAASANQEQAQ